jgi:uncharacterized membrane protein YccC
MLTIPAPLDPTIFAAAVVTVLAALFGGTIQLVNAISGARDRRDAREERRVLRDQNQNVIKVSEDTAKKADTIIEKAVEIHTLTNSANAKLQAALEMVTEKLAAAERQIARMEGTMRDVAASRVTTDRQIADALATPAPDRRHTDDALAPIDTNTKAIADNTAHPETPA